MSIFALLFMISRDCVKYRLGNLRCYELHFNIKIGHDKQVITLVLKGSRHFLNRINHFYAYIQAREKFNKKIHVKLDIISERSKA